MGTSTYKLQLYIPEIGEQGWGNYVDTNFDVIDNIAPLSVRTPEELQNALQEQQEYDRYVTISLLNDITFLTVTEITLSATKWVHISLNNHTLKNVKFKAPSSETNPYTFVIEGGTLDNVVTMSSVDYTVNMRLVVDSCRIVNSPTGLSTCESSISTLSASRIWFENCTVAVYISGTCYLHDCYIMNCDDSIRTYVMTKDIPCTITQCKVVGCKNGIYLKGKSYTLNNVTISGCTNYGIFYSPMYAHANLYLNDCMIYGITEGPGLLLEPTGTEKNDMSVSLDSCIICACANGGVYKNLGYTMFLNLKGDVTIKDNYSYGIDTVFHRENIRADDTLKIYCTGSLTGNVGIYNRSAHATDQLGECDDTTRGEENITCDNENLYAVRDGTTLLWKAP